jgi:hypothetical protein
VFENPVTEHAVEVVGSSPYDAPLMPRTVHP